MSQPKHAGLLLRKLLLSTLLTGIALLALPTISNAELTPVEDETLSDYTGQAFIKVDAEEYQDPNNSTRTYKTTRVNFGLTVDTIVNIKKLKLGEYYRADVAKADTQNMADIEIDDFAMGVVKDPTTGKARPFTITDPYLELAYENNKMIGLRVGFGTSRGVMSGDIRTLSGDMNVNILEKNACLKEFLGLCITRGDVNGVAKLLADDRGGAYLNGVTKGQKINTRAMSIGIPNGESLHTTSAIVGDLTAQGCNAKVLGGLLNENTCFPLAIYQSQEVGNRNPTTMEVTPAKGFFFSLASTDMTWRADTKNSSNAASNMVSVKSGYWMNVPSGNISLNFSEATITGLPRQKTCFGAYNQGC